MSGSTKNQGYPYPLTSDFADVQDAYRLAVAIDADVRAAQQPFRDFDQPLSWIARQTANGGGFTSGSASFVIQAIDWDNTGGLVLNATRWVQPPAQAPSWWLFGATLLSAVISGTPVVGDLLEARIAVTTTDQVTGLSTTTNAYQRNDESNQSGEWINVFTMAPIYRGSVNLALLLNGSTSKAVAGNSTFWGLYLGPVT
jgi:hypothetical protein